MASTPSVATTATVRAMAHDRRASGPASKRVWARVSVGTNAGASERVARTKVTAPAVRPTSMVTSRLRTLVAPALSASECLRTRRSARSVTRSTSIAPSVSAAVAKSLSYRAPRRSSSACMTFEASRVRTRPQPAADTNVGACDGRAGDVSASGEARSQHAGSAQK